MYFDVPRNVMLSVNTSDFFINAGNVSTKGKMAPWSSSFVMLTQHLSWLINNKYYYCCLYFIGFCEFMRAHVSLVYQSSQRVKELNFII